MNNFESKQASTKKQVSEADGALLGFVSAKERKLKEEQERHEATVAKIEAEFARMQAEEELKKKNALEAMQAYETKHEKAIAELETRQRGSAQQGETRPPAPQVAAPQLPPGTLPPTIVTSDQLQRQGILLQLQEECPDVMRIGGEEGVIKAVMKARNLASHTVTPGAVIA